MKQWGTWAAIIGGLFWLVKGVAILLTGNQPPLIYEIAPLFFAMALWGVYKIINGRSSRLAQIALILAILAGVSAVVVTLAEWFAPQLLPQGEAATVLTPFFVLAGFGTLIALLLLGITARRTGVSWGWLPILMAVGFPLFLAVMGGLSEVIQGNRVIAERLIELPVAFMGLAWLHLGFLVWQR